MSHYQSLISTIVPGCNPRHVEAVLRDKFGTLDHLSPGCFHVETVRAAEVAAFDTNVSETLAELEGL